MSAPDDRHPESGDASHFDFDDLVLDDDFVRAATISEASATARVERKREQQVRRSSRFPRPQARRLQRRWRNWVAVRPDDRRSRPAPDAPRMREWNRAQWTAVVVTVLLAGLFVWGLTGSRSGAHTAAKIPVAAATPAGADPVGSCRGVQASGTQIASTVVPCTAEHSVEITGSYPIATPTLTAAATTPVKTFCAEDALIYVGGTLPGYLKSGYLLPQASQWNSGDHSAECTINEVDNSGSLVPSTGTQRNSQSG